MSRSINNEVFTLIMSFIVENPFDLQQLIAAANELCGLATGPLSAFLGSLIIIFGEELYGWDESDSWQVNACSVSRD